MSSYTEPMVALVSPRGAAQVAEQQDTTDLLELFDPISLAEMEDVALLSRVDTKYLLSAGQLYALLPALACDYRALTVAGSRAHRYHTLYYDTEDLALYRQHHAGLRSRFKVRTRLYVDSGLSFLEVKHKTNKGRTIKSRLRTDALLTRLTPEAHAFLADAISLDDRALQPALWTDYVRITLVAKDRSERVTLDLDLSFLGGWGHATLNGVAIAEVKQARPDRGSPLTHRVRELGVRPGPVSKYCLGTALLRDDVKHNRFKPMLRRVRLLMEGYERVH